jgi:predicted anti-sigma-YlaC factor YlaD
MNNEELIKENLSLREENERLKNELNLTKEHLKKYTAPSCKKLYYEKNKEEIKQKVKQYKEQTNYVVPKEVIKERNKRAYQKRKQKLEKEKLERQNI